MAALFCYGTLGVEGVITRLIGRVPGKKPAQLVNYARRCIRDTDFPAIIPQKNGKVFGLLYTDLSPQEMVIIDDYEGRLYQRAQVWVTTEGGKTEHTWTYVLKQQHYGLLVDEPWSVDKYLGFNAEANG